jgi:hypothetical protein
MTTNTTVLATPGSSSISVPSGNGLVVNFPSGIDLTASGTGVNPGNGFPAPSGQTPGSTDASGNEILANFYWNPPIPSGTVAVTWIDIAGNQQTMQLSVTVPGAAPVTPTTPTTPTTAPAAGWSTTKKVVVVGGVVAVLGGLYWAFGTEHGKKTLGRMKRK